MSTWESMGYGLCMRGDWISRLWSPIWYHWYCPYPILIDSLSARTCVEADCCGCSNFNRYATAEQRAAALTIPE